MLPIPKGGTAIRGGPRIDIEHDAGPQPPTTRALQPSMGAPNTVRNIILVGSQMHPVDFFLLNNVWLGRQGPVMESPGRTQQECYLGHTQRLSQEVGLDQAIA